MIAINFLAGQTGIWVAILFLLIVRYWQNSVIAGIALGLLTIKPHMAMLWFVVMAAAGHWRCIGIAILTVAALCGVVTLWLGWAIWPEYFHALSFFNAFIVAGNIWFAHLAVSPFISLYAVGIPASVASIMQIMLSLMMVVCLAKAFRNKDVPGLEYRFALLAPAVLLVTPYALSYDLPLLAIAIIPLIIEAWNKGWNNGWELSAFALTLFVPYQSYLVLHHVPFGLMVLCFLWVVLYWRDRIYL